MILTDIQKRKFFEISGKEYTGDKLMGYFFTRSAFNDEKWNNHTPWIFSYVIEPDTGYLFCELDHRMTNNHIFGWDKDGVELPSNLIEKYFESHYW